MRRGDRVPPDGGRTGPSTRRSTIGALMVTGLVVAACGQASTPQALGAGAPSRPMCGLGVAAPTRIDHVVWVIMENHPYPDIVGNRSDAPYINGTLIPGCGLATDDHNVSHPSLPNYLALSAGAARGSASSSDCDPADCPQTGPTIYSALEASSLQWRVYEQSMPSNCARQDSGDYTAHHNPAAYYSGIRCAQWDVPMGSPGSGALASDLAADRLAALSVLVPDEANDMHSGSIGAGDAWLATWIPLITATPDYRLGHTAVFITWDEGEGGSKSDGEHCADQPVSEVSCWVPLIVMSAATPPGSRTAVATSHYSVLRTTESLLGLETPLGHAATASLLPAVFDLT
jgi:hypothetical protein